EPSSTIKESTNPGINGTNSAGKTGYHGPCPPSGTHRYYFYIYALDAKIDLTAGANKQELKTAIQPHIIAKGSIMGRYKKLSNQ
ncbi:MAG: phospholipid-binding protein family, partial [Chitinophagaceae bacterium]|nr:phospholipid-binding protein family [Chitinophagaceae bacterium]